MWLHPRLSLVTCFGTPAASRLRCQPVVHVTTPAYGQVAARDGFLPPCKSDTLDVLEKNLQAERDYVED